MSSWNKISRYIIKNKRKIWYPKGTPQHHLFLNLFFPGDYIYINGYDSINLVNEDTANDIYYKNKKLIIYFDNDTNEFIIPVSSDSYKRCQTINEVKVILEQSIDGLTDSEIDKIKGFKWKQMNK